MARIVGLMSVFNVQELVGDAIASILPVVDEVRVYDGRYTEYECRGPGEGGIVRSCDGIHANSCDRTESVVKSFDSLDTPVTYVKLAVMSEIEKRNMMMEKLAPNEVGLVIDDDELFYGEPRVVSEWAEREVESDIGWLNVLFLRHSTIPLVRLFRGGRGLGYGENYYRITKDGKEIVNMREVRLDSYRGHQHEILSPRAKLVELWNYRPLARIESQNEYNATIARKTHW